MAIFAVVGPLKLSFYQGKGGRTLRNEDIRAFWDVNRKYERRRGCYVFGIRAGKGYTPGYVGRATKGLKQEVFTFHKLVRYQQFMADYAKGTPVLFFALAPAQKGKPNNSQIRAIEKYLIDLAITANPDLLNIKDTKPLDWGIKGVVRGGKGKTSSGTRDFRRMLGIK
ncbi:MAG: hypothetical protein ACRD2L_11275 [Terriglobia bacterium]